ncbi:hypothetical protein FOA52_010084 [Chlamydomonas sp. UWO 241]|nr:hypothetical protein FOA52_010084 [Chlamydomonas sp. UWO 241]
MASSSSMNADAELLLEAVKGGTLQHVELALQRRSDIVNRPSSAEVYPVHLAVWRNHQAILATLLQAGAKPDLQDGESGWTCMHRALYYGSLVAARTLLLAGASLDIPDHQGRTPLDLLSRELAPRARGGDGATGSGATGSSSGKGSAGGGSGSGSGGVAGVYAWGSGANYQLGTGSTDVHASPVRVEDLGSRVRIVALAAGK